MSDPHYLLDSFHVYHILLVSSKLSSDKYGDSLSSTKCLIQKRIYIFLTIFCELTVFRSIELQWLHSHLSFLLFVLFYMMDLNELNMSMRHQPALILELRPNYHLKA